MKFTITTIIKITAGIYAILIHFFSYPHSRQSFIDDFQILFAD